MKILSFDIVGKMAHFRKYYTNSTALSYFIPPRTTIIGMIAAILGEERDEYYEKFSLDKCKIGITVNNKIKKINQRLNHLMIKGSSDLNGSKGPTQVPFEIVMPENIKNEFVSYKIFFNHSDDIINELHRRLIEIDFQYSLSLGTANFTAFTENIEIFSAKSIKTNDFININSAVVLEDIEDFNFSDEKKSMFITETIPINFNKNRELDAISEVIFNIDKKPLSVKLKKPYYSLTSSNTNINIVFLE